MSEQDYFILWSVYAGAAFILLLASIFFTGFLWRFIKEPIVLIVAILLFSPTLIDPEKAQYAPAITVMAMDFLMQVGDHQVAIVNDLFYKIEIALVAYFIFALFIRLPIEHFFGRLRQKRSAKKTDQYKSETIDSDDNQHQHSILHADERL